MVMIISLQAKQNFINSVEITRPMFNFLLPLPVK